MLKLIIYGFAWFIDINQWHDLHDYYLVPWLGGPPVSAIIITILVTIVLIIATFNELTKKGKK